MTLNKIGFYTLSDERMASNRSFLKRGELIITESCNFNCTYCRGIGNYAHPFMGHVGRKTVFKCLDYWIEERIENVRFSGGEPTIHPGLVDFVRYAEQNNVKRIAVSSNGSRNKKVYEKLIQAGVSDFSISLDGCCAEDVEELAGKRKVFDRIITNIKWLSKRVYTTVGVVLTEESQRKIKNTVEFADSLGVSDIRIITAAQYNGIVDNVSKIPQRLLGKFPILNYRINNLLSGRNIRGLGAKDSHRCHLVKDDSAAAGDWFYPCVIYMREGGEPIGRIGKDMREDRQRWSQEHDTFDDAICRINCLDCLVDFNNAVEKNLDNQERIG